MQWVRLTMCIHGAGRLGVAALDALAGVSPSMHGDQGQVAVAECDFPRGWISMLIRMRFSLEGETVPFLS